METIIRTPEELMVTQMMEESKNYRKHTRWFSTLRKVQEMQRKELG